MKSTFLLLSPRLWTKLILWSLEYIGVCEVGTFLTLTNDIVRSASFDVFRNVSQEFPAIKWQFVVEF